MHDGLDPVGPSLEQVGRTCFRPIKATPIFLNTKTNKLGSLSNQDGHVNPKIIDLLH